MATFFNISIDELLSYSPQMSKSDVKKLYIQLAENFAQMTFDDVLQNCRQYAKKYYSCWNLQFHIALLIINHIEMVHNPQQRTALIEEAGQMFQRIADDADEITLRQQAVNLKAFCLLLNNRPAEVIDLLDEMKQTSISSEILLANAFQMKGEPQKAVNILQADIYKKIIDLMNTCPLLMTICAENVDKVDMILDRILRLGEIFDVYHLHPTVYLQIYFAAAHVFLTQSNKEEALRMLENYAKIAIDPHLFPLKLHGDVFFDSLDDFFDSLQLGTQMPRSEKVVKQSIVDSVINDPAFQILHEESRYKVLCKKLEQLKE